MDGQMVDFWLGRFCDPSTKCQNCSDEQEKPGEMEEFFLKVLWLLVFFCLFVFVVFGLGWFSESLANLKNHCISKDGLELIILLPSPPMC